MSYVAPVPEAYLGQVVPDGQCVAYVKKAAGCPVTNRWSPGKRARGGKLPKGTAIAVFQDGQYNNYTDGRSHAAILIKETAEALIVYDQWVGQVVHERAIRFKGGVGKPVNDGDAFYVIEDRVVLASARAREAAKKKLSTALKADSAARKRPPKANGSRNKSSRK